MVQRIAATIAATLILWFLWWFLGGLSLLWIGYSIGGPVAEIVVGFVFWTVVALIPFLIWRRLKKIPRPR